MMGHYFLMSDIKPSVPPGPIAAFLARDDRIWLSQPIPAIHGLAASSMFTGLFLRANSPTLKGG